MKLTKKQQKRLETIWRLIRPEFYNRITWAIVFVGLGLIGTPIWEAIFEAILTKELRRWDIILQNRNEPIFGFALIVLALSYNVIIKLRQVENYSLSEPQEIELDIKPQVFDEMSLATILRKLKDQLSEEKDTVSKLLVVEFRSNLKALKLKLNDMDIQRISEDFKKNLISKSKSREKLIFDKKVIIELIKDSNHELDAIYN